MIGTGRLEKLGGAESSYSERSLARGRWFNEGVEGPLFIATHSPDIDLDIDSKLVAKRSSRRASGQWQCD